MQPKDCGGQFGSQGISQQTSSFCQRWQCMPEKDENYTKEQGIQEREYLEVRNSNNCLVVLGQESLNHMLLYSFPT